MAESGACKSPPMDMALAPHHEYDGMAERDYRRALEAYEAAMDDYNHEREWGYRRGCR